MPFGQHVRGSVGGIDARGVVEGAATLKTWPAQRRFADSLHHDGGPVISLFSNAGVVATHDEHS